MMLKEEEEEEEEEGEEEGEEEEEEGRENYYLYSIWNSHGIHVLNTNHSVCTGHVYSFIYYNKL
jgi:hypothetical protein